MAVELVTINSHNLQGEDIPYLESLLNGNDELNAAFEKMFTVIGKLMPNYIKPVYGWNLGDEYSARSIKDILESKNGDWVELSGPGSSSLIIGKKCLSYRYDIGYFTFITNNEVQDSVRAVAKVMAGIFKAGMVLYVPDSGYKLAIANDWVIEGRSFDEILISMDKLAGAPALAIHEIHTIREGMDYTDGYFVEKIG